MKIAIITAEPKNYVPEELKKEAEKAGHECEIIDVAKIVHVEATNTSSVFHDNKPLVADVIIPRLNEHQLDIKLGLLTRLETSGMKMINSAESMALCNDKLKSQIVLNQLGLRTPWSAIVHDDEQLNTALEIAKAAGLEFPMILKTLRGTHGIGVMKVDSPSSLTSVAQAMLAEGQQLMIQEFIEHDSSYRMITVGSELLAANERGQPKEKDEFRTNSHLGSETKKYEPSEEELSFARTIVERFGCNFCAIDYIKLKDGVFLILEVNSSPGLEAIQKDWEGEKNLPEGVIKFTLDFIGANTVTEPQSDVEPEPAAAEAAEAPEQIAPVPAEGVVTLGDTTEVTISRLMDAPVEARVDTGAKLCSLHVDNLSLSNDWVRFTRGDVTYKVPLEREAKIRAHGELRVRPVVLLDMTIGGKLLQRLEFTLNNRDTMKYEVLVGRNALGALGIPVMVDQPTEVGSEPAEIEVAEEE